VRITELSSVNLTPPVDFHPRMVGLTGTYDQVKAACKSYRVYFSTPPDKKPGEISLSIKNIVNIPQVMITWWTTPSSSILWIPLAVSSRPSERALLLTQCAPSLTKLSRNGIRNRWISGHRRVLAQKCSYLLYSYVNSLADPLYFFSL
jgi:SCO1/SenC